MRCDKDITLTRAHKMGGDFTRDSVGADAKQPSRTGGYTAFAIKEVLENAVRPFEGKDGIVDAGPAFQHATLGT